MTTHQFKFVACVASSMLLTASTWAQIAVQAEETSAGQAESSGTVLAVKGIAPDLVALMTKCAPTVHPQTMAAVVSAESRGNQFAIADAGPVNLPWAQRKFMVRSLYPKTLEEAVATAQLLIKNGHTVSLGIAQINDRNLVPMKVSINQVFDLCTNLSIGGRILTDFYRRATLQFGAGKNALHAALSAYNSGDWYRGANDGYVSRVYRQIGIPLAVRSNSAQRLPVPQLEDPQIETATQERQFTLEARDFSIAEVGPSP